MNFGYILTIKHGFIRYSDDEEVRFPFGPFPRPVFAHDDRIQHGPSQHGHQEIHIITLMKTICFSIHLNF